MPNFDLKRYLLQMKSIISYSTDSKLVHGAFLHASGTVNAEDLAVDPGAVLRSEEANNASDVDGQTDTVNWGPAGGVFVDFVIGKGGSAGDVFTTDGVVHVCLDATRRDGVDGDLLVAKIYPSQYLLSTLEKMHEWIKGGHSRNLPMAMQRTNVSIVPLEPE